MDVYLDSSTLRSVILQQQPKLANWAEWDRSFTSTVTRTECRRTIDRARLEGHLSDDETVALAQDLLRRLLVGVAIIELTPVLLREAGAPMTTVVRTLDAIHLVTARAARLARAPQLVFATHDRRQATAAVAMGFDVMGI